MPLRAPLAALLLLCASFARAAECDPNGFAVAEVEPHCASPLSDDPRADPDKVPPEDMKMCSLYVQRVLAGCREKLKTALVEKLRLERQPPSPERERALAKASANVEDAEAGFEGLRENANIVLAQDPDAPNEYRVRARAFHAMFKHFDITPAGQIDMEIGSAQLNARKTVALDPDETASGGSGTPPIRPETERKLLDLANKILPPPSGKPGEQIKPDQLATGTELYLLANRPGEAERPAKLLVEKGDKRGPSLLAQVALMRNRPEEAAQWAEKALALDPNDKRAKDALAFAKAQMSAAKLKRPGAVGFGEKAPEQGGPGVAQAAGLPAAAPADVTFTPKTALAPGLRRAYEKLKMNDLVEALSELNVHLDANPEDREARTVRAEVLLKLGKPEPALADCDRVLADDPSDARALRAKAAALYDLGRDAEALATIEKALALDAGSAAAHLIRAKILERLGRAAEALAEYDNAARLDPANEPIAEAAAKRLGRAAAEPRAVARRFLRGGFVTIATALLLLGLIGGGVAYTRRKTTSKPPAPAARERTLGKGDLVARQYRITRELGRGGMGVVFEALDEKLNRFVALKQLSAECRGSAEDAARFLQEARLVAQLKHPNVAEIHAAVEDGGLFLVFELVRGKSLDKLLAGPVSPEQARGIIAAACAALTAAHARRIVHRDLKPSNIMISDDGEIKVMDFGIAHQSRTGATMTQTAFSGTPPYMAPEQAMGSVSSASDLYALGVMSYELVTGVRPFDGPDYLGPKMRGDFPRATSRSGKLPVKLDAFFAAALSPDPAKRPRDAKAFAEAFAACWS